MTSDRHGPPLRRLHRFLARLHLAALARPGSTLLLALVAVLALGAQVPRLRTLLSLESLGEPALPSTRVNRRMRETFQTGHELGVIVAGARRGSGLTSAQIEKLGDWVARERSGDPDVVGVTSPFTVRRLRSMRMFPLPVPYVVLGTREEMDDLAGSVWGGILTDHAKSDLAIQLDLRDAPGGSRFGRFDPAAVGRISASLDRDVLAGDSLQAYLVGPAAFDYYSLLGIRRFRLLNGLMLLLILLLLRVWLGTWRSGAILAGVLLVTFVGVAGAMSLAGHPIDLLTTGLFLILAVAALEDFLFLSYLRLADPGSWRRCFRVMLVPSLLTSLTTVIGFWSLCVSDLAIVRRLGFWAGVGAAVEWVVIFTVLPALLARYPACRAWTDSRRAWGAGVLARVVGRGLPRAVAMGLLLVHVAGAYAAWHLNRNDSIAKLFDERNPYRRGFEYVAASRGYQGSLSVVLPGASDRDRVEAALRRVSGVNGVVRVLDPYQVLDDAAGGRRVEPAEIAAGDTAVARRMRGLLAPDGSLRAVVYLADVELLALEKTVGALKALCRREGGYVGGELVTYAEFADRVPATLFGSLGLCLLLVGAVLLALLVAAGQRGKLPVLLASMWGPAAMMILLWVLRVPLSFLTCIFASVLVGMAGDNVIQYVFATRRDRLQQGIQRRGVASILVALSMALACLVFTGSAFVPSRRLGLLLALGFLLSLAGDLWVLRGLLAPARGVGAARAPADGSSSGGGSHGHS